MSDEAAAQMLVNPLTTVVLRREAEEHVALGYDGVLVQTAAGSSVGRLLTGVSQAHSPALVDVVRSPAPPSCAGDSRPCLSWRQSVRAGPTRSARHPTAAP